MAMDIVFQREKTGRKKAKDVGDLRILLLKLSKAVRKDKLQCS
jgi:hypothetical protein